MPTPGNGWRRRACLLLATSALLVMGAVIAMGATSPADAPKNEKRILLLVDGVSPDMFRDAQRAGHFQRFRQVAAHVAPFPSISDYSWSLVLQGKKAFGRAGRIGQYEAAFFDEGAAAAAEDGRAFFHRLAKERTAYAAVDTMLNPFIEGLAYFPTTEIRRMELAQVERDLLAAANGPVSVAFFTVPDAIAHTRPSQLGEELAAIDAMVERVVAKFAERGQTVRIDLVADHGQSAALSSTKGEVAPAADRELKSDLGHEEGEGLATIDLAALAKAAGLQKVDRLRSEVDVVFPVLALASYTGAWTSSNAASLALARASRQASFFDLAIVRQPPSATADARVRIVGKENEAILDVRATANGRQVRYAPQSGDPLGLKRFPTGWVSTRHPAFETPERPWAIARIAAAALEEEAAMPDVLFSFADGYRIEGPLEGLTTMYQTHGSLTRSATLGVLASTRSEPLPAQVLSEDILDVIDLPLADLYAPTVADLPAARAVLKAETAPAVKTGAQDLSSLALFRRMARVSDLSRDILREDVAEAFLALLPSISSAADLPLSDDVTATDWRQLLTAEEIAGAIDAILQTEDVDKLANDPRLTQLPDILFERVKGNDEDKSVAAEKQGDAETEGNAEEEPAKGKESADESAVDLPAVTHASRIAVMRAHGLRALLERALLVEERSSIADPRDIGFAARWHSQWSAHPTAAPIAHREEERRRHRELFHHILEDRQLAADVYPARLTSLYPLVQHERPPPTFVYFPGIYDEVFDGQLFRDGLRALEDLGARVLEAPSEGSCHAALNAKRIGAFLDRDREERRRRGRPATDYVFIGYSKGAVDALHLMAQRPQWAADHVSALVTIAAPLSGAQVLARRDLGQKEFELLTGAPPPPDCREPKNAAGPSMTRAAMATFFAEHGRSLSAATRYFSLSFESSLKDAHLWMKLTKNIAGFREPNDGVVAVADSKFPVSFDATDLGTLPADHLAGLPTATTDVDQRALFEAIFLFLQESGGLSNAVTDGFRDRVRAHSPWTTVEDRRAHLAEILARSKVDLTERSTSPVTFASMVQRALSATPYEVGPFSLETDGSKWTANPLRRRAFFGFSYVEQGAPIDVTDGSSFANAILGPLRVDGNDLSVPTTERWRRFPKSERPLFTPPANNIAFDTSRRINLRNFGSLIDGKRIEPILPGDYPGGIPIVTDRRRVKVFRDEFEFFWEDLSPAPADENLNGGWAADVDAQGRVMARLNSDNTSARLTSFSLRFRPRDFPQLTLELAVDKNTEGADVTRGGSGRDDSAFQLWFALREIDDDQDRAAFDPDSPIYLFGYYWSDDESTAAGTIVENTYSQRDFVVAQLPKTMQLALGNTEHDENAPPTVFRQDLRQDLARAFPTLDVERLEVIAVTFQHDSNDIEGSSQARLYRAHFAPDGGATK